MNKCKIGCESETKEGFREEMRQDEIEKLAFFYLCEEEDQNILKKKGKMTYKDFRRFDYLTRRLEFWEYNKKIWEEFSAGFKERISIFSGEESETLGELEEQEKWWKSLIKKKESLDSESDC